MPVLALISTPAASAGPGHHARVVAAGSIPGRACNLRRGGKSSNHGRRTRRCAQPVASHRRHAPLVATPAPLGAEQVGPQGVAQPSSPGASTLPGGSQPRSPGETPSPINTPWPSETNGVLTDPIDPRYLTSVPFGRTSFWVQPWRAYLDTWPAPHLLDSVGINFNVPQAQAEATAQLLQDTGFKLARIGFGWNGLSYSEPTKLRPNYEEHVRARLIALRNHGLRPLIVLDANSGAPTPLKVVKLETLQPAAAGSQTVVLSPASAAQVVPGKTGFNSLTFGGLPDILITSVGPGDVARLSRTLPNPLPAGPHGGSTLLYAPFGPPKLANGNPNPTFQATFAGWMNYVATATRFVAGIMGPGGFDVEIWNELTFGSQFLNSEYYYSTKTLTEEGVSPEGEPEKKKRVVTKQIVKALLDSTVAYVHNPANGLLPSVGVTSGFASQSPFPSGADAPPGLTALSKHPYVQLRSFPSNYVPGYIRPVNGVGRLDTQPKEPPPFTPLFVPSFEALMPEYMLTANATETMIRDLAPFTTEVYGFPHGREVGPQGPVQKWITEYNLGVPKSLVSSITPADKAHFHAKALLRSLVAMVSKGVSREYFYAAVDGPYSLVGPEFLAALEAHPGTYPGDQLGGEILNGFHNMLSRFNGPGPTAGARQLKLLSIAQVGEHAQFIGDGTAAHPSLYDRDMLGVFPYQSSPTHFVVPVYVMTSDLLTLYEPGAPTSDINRFDLPEETFKVTLGNLPETGEPPDVSAYDPLHDQSTPARLLSREGDQATFEIAATDYPRLLSIDYTGK